MNIDAVRFRAIASAILPRGTTLAADEAVAVVQLCFLVTEADLAETISEHTIRVQVSRHVCALASISFDDVPLISPLPLPIDLEARAEILRDIASRLRSVPARELAYVLAYLVAVEDGALVPIEDAVTTDLREVLRIPRARAEELVAHAAEQVTPFDSGEPAEARP